MQLNCENYLVHIGWTPFHEAAVKGHYSLILKNVNHINPRNHEGITLDMGCTPFHEVAVKDHLEITQHLFI